MILRRLDSGGRDSSEINWETITPHEVNENWHLNQNEPKPIIPLATDKLPLTCLFETREGTKGVLQLLGPTADNKSARVRYKLLRLATPQTQPDAEGPRQRHFVRLVVGEDGTTMTFEGKKTTWEELPEMLEKVADRPYTVLELARPSDEITIQQQNNARFRAGRLAQRLGFEYLSVIGVHPLGSKGSPPQSASEEESPDQSDPPAAQPFRKAYLPDVDTRDTGVVLDLATGALLRVPNPKGNVPGFKVMGKGDLFFDRVLGCLRDGKAMRWNGNRYVALPAEYQRLDATAYKLPEVPCRLLITTAEKKHFEVNALSVPEDGGIHIEYRPADPRLVPDPEQSASLREGAYPPAASGTAKNTIRLARTQVAALRTAIELYRLDVGAWPTAAQGLSALQVQPDGLPEKTKWSGPYQRRPLLLDPWGNPYQYSAPGKHNADSFDLWSKGHDGLDGTKDDVGNWPSPPEKPKSAF